MIPRNAGFGLHHAMSGGELWGTVVMLVVFLIVASIIATAIGHRRLAEIAPGLRQARHRAPSHSRRGRSLRALHRE
jgi:hypothetical protein